MQLAREELCHGREDLLQILVVFGVMLGHAGGDLAGDNGADHVLDMLLQVLAVEHLAALFIDNVALHVHDIVILQHVLTCSVSIMLCIRSEPNRRMTSSVSAM